ncbi:MAG TPA: hypothetical protein VNK95_02850 [Caldilineaceae bacterium]|nr:hypothetical protein [Caldilineaceae bacterium]
MENQPGSEQSQSQSQGTTGATGQPSPGQETKAGGQELVDELNRLGNKFIEVVEVAWNSEQRRRIEDDLRKGLQSLATSLEEGLKQLGESQQTKEFLGAAEDVAESVSAKVRSSKITNELADSLARGLRALSDRMDRLARDMQSRAAGQPGPTAGENKPDTPQDIPIQRE